VILDPSANPFVPTFGASPPVIAGRDTIIEDIVEGLETGPGHPEYTAILTGARGTGKTVALNDLQRRAQSLGWHVIAIDASLSAFIDERAERARRLRDDQAPPAAKRRVTGVTAGPVGVDFKVTPPAASPSRLRDVLTDLAQLLAANGTGLLITIDQFHTADTDEVRAFGAVIQHVTRREQNTIAFAAAALPVLHDELMRGDRSTFLQRCAWHELDTIPLDDVSAALRETVELAGATITDDALALASRATTGFAFMVQLVGHHMWRLAESTPIDIDAARRAVHTANNQLGRQVFEPSWRTLSDVDREFLLAMAMDPGETAVADLITRMGRTGQFVNRYRHRLLRSGWIRPLNRGGVELTHAAAREWIRQQADPETRQG
jgi:hypothetical protein